MRAKLTRWPLPRPTAIHARVAVRQFSEHGKVVPPRIMAALLSSAWNRWTTARRFQRRHEAANVCMLSCAADAEDSIEHYWQCPVLQRVARSYLKIAPPSLGQFLGVDTFPSLEDQALSAVLTYAAYVATNQRRNLPAEARGGPTVAYQAVLQACLYLEKKMLGLRTCGLRSSL